MATGSTMGHSGVGLGMVGMVGMVGGVEGGGGLITEVGGVEVGPWEGGVAPLALTTLPLPFMGGVSKGLPPLTRRAPGAIKWGGVLNKGLLFQNHHHAHFFQNSVQKKRCLIP